MTIAFEAKPIKTEPVRKGWNSETVKHTFSDNFDAMVFFESVFVCRQIGEWKEIENNQVTVFTCSAD